MRSRRDLRRINVIMGQAAAMAAGLRKLPPPRTLVDLGSGDGHFLLQVARRLEWLDVTAVLCDRQAIVSEKTRRGFEALQWRCEMRQGDIFQTLEDLEPGAVVTANLFLHHFQDADLKRLLALAAARAGAFVAVEPRRSPFALLGARLVWCVGANAVTRHDAVASVRAGFCDDELTALWPRAGWRLEERGRFPYSHCFTAIKNDV